MSSLGDLDFMQDLVKISEFGLSVVRDTDLSTLMMLNSEQGFRVSERLREQGPPSPFRLIDCKSTSQHRRVVLVDGCDIQSYTAISHTWGQDVYGTFDCECAAECSAQVPRCSDNPCPGAVAHGERHRQVISDILKMCDRLMKAGSEFVWHDGVCIAQHNNVEVEEAIRHMGWIYASAKDTVIFLDYVGKPRALVQLDNERKVAEATRWDTRVWTVQEALLSKNRRYCIRYVPIDDDSRDCNNTITWADRWLAFKAKLAHCREDDSCIAVVAERELWTQILSLFGEVVSILVVAHKSILPENQPSATSSGHRFCDASMALFSQYAIELTTVVYGLLQWSRLFLYQLVRFPSLYDVLEHCAESRESKHKGDRINSILGLAGITDFVADKDKNVEASTIEFVKRLGQNDIRRVLFSVNDECPDEVDGEIHTWLPCFSRPFRSGRGLENILQRGGTLDLGKSESWGSLLNDTRDQNSELPRQAFDDVECNVLEDGMLRLRGTLHCVSIGVAVVKALPEPAFLREQISGVVSMGLSLLQLPGIGYKNFYKALVDTDIGSNIGWVMLPSRGCVRLERNPFIQGRGLIEEGETVSAHLVTASLSTHLHLLVQGNDLGAPVSRLGVFVMEDVDLLDRIIKHTVTWHPGTCTVLQQLVIK